MKPEIGQDFLQIVGNEVKDLSASGQFQENLTVALWSLVFCCRVVAVAALSAICSMYHELCTATDYITALSL
jgi:hypothetical protein